MTKLAILALAGSACAGCAGVTIQPNRELLPDTRPYVYSDKDWAVVLRDYVKGGLVDYDGLLRNPTPLHRYYALVSETGPTQTPEQFASSQDAVTYWINVYNALVLCAVLHRYPVLTMYDLSLPQLSYGYKFRVDGQVRTLAWIEQKVFEESKGDVRTLLATSRGALGTPPLGNEPIRAQTLERQLAEAAARALDSPHILRVDHTAKEIYVWQLIFRRQEDFVIFWRTRRRASAVYTYNVLLELASNGKKRALRSAVGYTIKEAPFNRGLNRWSPPPAPPATP